MYRLYICIDGVGRLAQRSLQPSSPGLAFTTAMGMDTHHMDLGLHPTTTGVPSDHQLTGSAGWSTSSGTGYHDTITIERMHEHLSACAVLGGASVLLAGQHRTSPGRPRTAVSTSIDGPGWMSCDTAAKVRPTTTTGTCTYIDDSLLV